MLNAAAGRLSGTWGGNLPAIGPALIEKAMRLAQDDLSDEGEHGDHQDIARREQGSIDHGA